MVLDQLLLALIGNIDCVFKIIWFVIRPVPSASCKLCCTGGFRRIPKGGSNRWPVAIRSGSRAVSIRQHFGLERALPSEQCPVQRFDVFIPGWIDFREFQFGKQSGNRQWPMVGQREGLVLPEVQQVGPRPGRVL